MCTENKLLITGIPRSGTSLLTSLISLDLNNLCFSEPEFVKKIKKISTSKKEVSENVIIEIEKLRNSIKGGNKISMRFNQDLSIPDNYFKRVMDKGKLIIKKSSIHKAVTLPKEDYKKRIVLKNNLLFTSCLSELAIETPLIALIRNPVSVLQSWQSLNLPVSKGKVQSGLKYSNSLREISQIEPLLLRQIKIIDWFYHNYKKSKGQVDLVKYEDLVLNPHAVLKKYIEPYTTLPRLKSNNENKHYSSRQQIEEIVKLESILYKEVYCEGRQ